MRSSRSAFTLIELLVVIAIIGILAIVVVMTLNPAELLRQSRDANRLSDLATLNSALSLYQTDQNGASGFSLGNASSVYLSLPDASSTCTNLGLPTSSGSFNYACATAASSRNINNSGWIPVNLSLELASRRSHEPILLRPLLLLRHERTKLRGVITLRVPKEQDSVRSDSHHSKLSRAQRRRESEREPALQPDRPDGLLAYGRGDGVKHSRPVREWQCGDVEWFYDKWKLLYGWQSWERSGHIRCDDDAD